MCRSDLDALSCKLVTWYLERLIAAEECLAPGVFFKYFPVCYVYQHLLDWFIDGVFGG